MDGDIMSQSMYFLMKSKRCYWTHLVNPNWLIVTGPQGKTLQWNSNQNTMFLIKFNWKYLLQNIGYIVPTSMCWVSPWTWPPGIHLLDAFLPNIKSLDSKPMDEFLMTNLWKPIQFSLWRRKIQRTPVWRQTRYNSYIRPILNRCDLWYIACQFQDS